MSGPFGVSVTLISGGQESGEIVLAAATFLSMSFLTIDCICTDRHLRLEFLTALKRFTGRPGMHSYQSADWFAQALSEPDSTISTKGLFWLALDKAGDRLAREMFHSHGEAAETRMYHSVHKLNRIEPPIAPPPETPVLTRAEVAYFAWFESLYAAILPWRQIIKSIQSDFS